MVDEASSVGGLSTGALIGLGIAGIIIWLYLTD